MECFRFFQFFMFDETVRTEGWLYHHFSEPHVFVFTLFKEAIMEGWNRHVCMWLKNHRVPSFFFGGVFLATLAACGGGGSSSGSGGGLSGTTATAAQTVGTTASQSLSSASSGLTATNTTSSPSPPFNFTHFLITHAAKIIAAHNTSPSVSSVNLDKAVLLAKSTGSSLRGQIRSFSPTTYQEPCTSGSGTVSMSFSGTSISMTSTYSSCAIGGVTMNGTMSMSMSGLNSSAPLASCGRVNYFNGTGFTVHLTFSKFSVTPPSGGTAMTMGGGIDMTVSGSCNPSAGTANYSITEKVPTGGWTMTSSAATIDITAMNFAFTLTDSNATGLPIREQLSGSMTVSNSVLAGTPFSGALVIKISPALVVDISSSNALSVQSGGIINVNDSSNGNTMVITAEAGNTVQVVTDISGTTSTASEPFSSFWI